MSAQEARRHRLERGGGQGRRNVFGDIVDVSTHISESKIIVGPACISPALNLALLLFVLFPADVSQAVECSGEHFIVCKVLNGRRHAKKTTKKEKGVKPIIS